MAGKLLIQTTILLKLDIFRTCLHFFEYLTVGEYLSYLLMDKNLERKNKLLQLVDLSEKNKISTMSRGMRQRLV